MARRFASLCLTFAAAVTLSGQNARPAPPSADFVFPGDTTALSAPLTAALATLKAPAIGAHIAALSSAGFDGRGLGARGLDAAADYVASALALAGVPPLTPGDPSSTSTARGATDAYFHPVPVREITRPAGSVTVSVTAGGAVATRVFLSGVDCLFQERPPADVDAPVVFAGYGIREQSPPRDDYANLVVKDRVVVLLPGVPDGTEWQSKQLAEKYASDSSRRRYEAKAQLARSLGARAVVAIEGDGFASVLAAGSAAPAARYFVPYDAGADNDGTLPVVRVSAAVGDTLLAAAGLTSDSARRAAPQPLGGLRLTLHSSGEERLVMSRNVVAALPGSDPSLRDRAVVIGAHMDHLGRVGDTVYPGADDNASGTAALLEIARAFASGPQRPRRTLVFVFWTGEEEGHLGSEYYVRHPLWPLDRTTVYLNLDMVGHPWKLDEIRQLLADTKLDKAAAFLAKAKAEDFIELGVAESAPDLDGALTLAARGTGVALHLDRTDGRSGGSDYRAFARQGLPFVRFFGNYFDGYHEPTDTADQVDPAQVLKMARLAFSSAWLLADRTDELRGVAHVKN